MAVRSEGKSPDDKDETVDDTGSEETTEETVGTEEPSDKTNNDDVRKSRAEAARLAKALEGQQARVKELEEFKKKAEREKMSETEKLQSEIADYRKENEKLLREAAEKEARLHREKLINKLVASDFEDPDFGDIVLAQYDSDSEDFDSFVTRMKGSRKYSRFFKSAKKERPVAPASPASSSGRAGNKVHEATASEKAWAESTYPNNKEMQKLVLQKLKDAKKRRSEESA